MRYLVLVLLVGFTLPSYSVAYGPNIWGMWQVHKCISVRTTVLLTQAVPDTVVMKGSKCSIQSGSFMDPYTGITQQYKDGLDIDHIVPRKWAWDHGASRWTLKQRYAFANDPLNLVAVSDNVNRSKGDKPPSMWLPSNPLFKCEYVTRYDLVVKKYKLKYDAREKAFVKTNLKTFCKR